MRFLDKAKDLVGQNKDKIRQGIDAAEKQARKYVPEQHSSKVSKAVDMAHKGVDKVDGPEPTSATDGQPAHEWDPPRPDDGE